MEARLIAFAVATCELLVARACGAVPGWADLVGAVLLAGALGWIAARAPIATALPILVYAGGVMPALLAPGWQTDGVWACLAGVAAIVARRRPIGVRAQAGLYAAVVAVAWARAAWVDGRPPPAEVVALAGAAAMACVALGKWAPVLAPLALWPVAPEAWTATGPAPAGRDVVLITVDTLRVDAARTMTRLPGPVREVQSSAPWTLPSLASILTGREPAEHGAMRLAAGFGRVRDDVPLLAETFAAAGWDTAAAVESPFCDPAFGLHRGFARYHAHHEWVLPRARDAERARPVAGVALAAFSLAPPDRWGADARADDVAALLAERRDRPLFLWVHLIEPHLPYRHSDDAFLRSATRLGLLADLNPVTFARLRGAYAGEVAVADAAIGRIRAAAAGAVVVVTADHGEEFGEHGGFEHGHSMYQEVVGVPLATNEPALDAVVATRELARALPAVAGVPGATWSPDPSAPRATTNPLYGPRDLRAVRVGDAKRIAVGEKRETFDLAADPAERAPLDDTALEPLLPPVPDGDGAAVPLDPGMRARLQALGYAEP